MSRQASITQEQVNAAAETIRADGIKPTARSVRDALGGGSITTVLKLLHIWQNSQSAAEERTIVLPVNIHRALLDLVGQEVAAAKVGPLADLVAAQQANGDLIVENERQSSTIALQAEALELAQAENAQLAGRLVEVESQLTRCQEHDADERKAAETARTERAMALLRLQSFPRIEAEADHLRAEAERERNAKVAAEQVAAVAVAKLDAMTDRANKAEAKAEEAEKKAHQSSQAFHDARVQIQAQQTALEVAKREMADVHLQAKTAREDANKLGEVAAELRGRIGGRYKPLQMSVRGA